jgi:fucose permease
MVILTGFVFFGAYVVVLWTGLFLKRISSKKGRTEIKQQVGDTVNFMKTDSYFRENIHKELRGPYIALGIVVIALIGAFVDSIS